jgi:ABC-type transport system involved in multi-copper enzyme maturation permease subunit
MNNYSILFKAEFKRFWTPAMIVTAFGIIAFGNVIAFGMGTMKQLPKTSNLVEICYSIVSFFSVILFSAGIVGSDIKSGWLRTLLIRPVTRQQYVLTKISVVITVALATLAITILLPIVYFTLLAESKIIFDASSTVTFLMFKSCEVVLYIVISTGISCWISGAFNSLALYIWFGSSQLMEMLISKKYWDIPWLMTLKDFMSPSGFQDALNYSKLGLGFPVEYILWGIASVAFFAALMLISINRIQIDTGSE